MNNAIVGTATSDYTGSILEMEQYSLYNLYIFRQ